MTYNNEWLENISKWFIDKGAILNYDCEQLFLKIDKYSNFEPRIKLNSEYDLFATLFWGKEENKYLLMDVLNQPKLNTWLIKCYQLGEIKELEAHHFPERNIKIVHGEQQ